MILTLAYTSSFFPISFAMKDRDNVVIIQYKEKRTRSGPLYVTSIYLYAITISYYSIVRYKNIDKAKTGAIYGFAAPIRVPSKAVGEWNTFEIQAINQKYKVALNDEKTRQEQERDKIIQYVYVYNVKFQ
jgi:hypothetical protein